MGIFRRLGNIFSGKANKILDDVENPIEQLDLDIRRRKEAIVEAKKQSAKYIGSVDQQKEDIVKVESKIKDYEKGIIKALTSANSADITNEKRAELQTKAKLFTTEKMSLQADLETKISVYEKTKTSSEQTQADIKNLEKTVKELESRKHELSARLTTAEAKSKVNEIIANVNKNSNLSIDDIEAKIREKESYANGLGAFAPSDIDSDLKAYISTDSDIDVEQELEKYKQMIEGSANTDAE